MKLSIQEKKILYAYACPNHHNTVTRLKWLTALTVDPDSFYRCLRMEMDEYYQLKYRLRVLQANTDYEEELYDEAV